MRRGLMAWDENELPKGTLMERIEGLLGGFSEELVGSGLATEAVD